MNTALIGYGYWGKILHRYLNENDYFRDLVLCDPMLDNGVDIEDILENEKIKNVFICTPIDTHYPLVREMLLAKKHVFCEKPLCKKIEETRDLLDLARKQGCTLYTDYIYTNSPSINFIKERRHQLGAIRYCELSIRQFGKFYKEDDVFDVLAVHMISAISYILNLPLDIKRIEIKAKSSANRTENATVYFKTGQVHGRIDSSLLSDDRERRIDLICQFGIIRFDMERKETVKIIRFQEDGKGGYTKSIVEEKSFDESNNLRHALSSFHEYIKQSASNDEVTLNVSSALEQIYEKKIEPMSIL